MNRQELVRTVSDMLGDLEVGLTTQVSAVPTAVWDAARTEPDGHWTDAWMSINGVERRVTNYVGPGVFTVNAFPFPVSAGMEYELRRDQLHTRAQIVQYLNAAVRDVSLITWLPLDSIIDLGDSVVVADQLYEYAIPQELESLYRVLYLEEPSDGPLEDQHTWAPVDHNAWKILRAGYVTIVSPADLPRAGSILRFLGARRPREMSSETSRCEIGPNFAMNYAAKLMCLRMVRGPDNDRYKTLYAAFREEEQRARMAMRLRQPVNTVRTT